MLPKRLLYWILLITVITIFNGCAATEKSKKERFQTQVRNAGDDCIRWGYVRNTEGYHRCIYSILGLKKHLVYTDHEWDEGEIPEDMEVVCRTVKFTGSRIKRRVCTVEREWAKLDQKNKDNMDEFRREFDAGDRGYVPSGGDEMGGQSGGMPR